MKKASLVILQIAIGCLILSGNVGLKGGDAFAQEQIARMAPAIGVMGGAATAAACATTDSTLPSDVAGVHGFEVGDPLTWTEVADTQGFLDMAADISAYTTGAPAGLCGLGVKVVIPDGNSAGDAYIRYDYGSNIDMTGGKDIYIYFYLVSLPEADAFKVMSAGAVNAPLTSGVFAVQLYNSAGTLYLRAEGVDNSTGIAVTTDTWHLVKVHLDADQAAAGSSITVDATTQTFQRIANNLRYFFLGAFSTVGADEPSTFAIDLFAIDTP